MQTKLTDMQKRVLALDTDWAKVKATMTEKQKQMNYKGAKLDSHGGGWAFVNEVRGVPP